ncbi:A-kinase anchor protein 8-like [Mantella aurantiaca]
MMDVGGSGSSFSQGYGMPPDLLSIPDRTLHHSKFEFSESRNSGWQSERGNSLWDRPGRPYKGFQRPFDRNNTRGMDDHFSRKKKKADFHSNPADAKTPDEIEISKHFASSQHVEVIKHLYIFLPKQRVDFIQDYLNFERNKVYQERNRQKLQPRKDSFKGIGQEHFFHRVDAAHCLACDTLILNIPELLIEHTKSESHVQKCKMSFKDIKSIYMAMAKAILQDKYVLELLKVYNKK